MQEEIHGNDKENGINDAGNNNPLPQFVLPDKQMRFIIALNRYNDLFEQLNYFAININELKLNEPNKIDKAFLLTGAKDWVFRFTNVPVYRILQGISWAKYW